MCRAAETVVAGRHGQEACEFLSAGGGPEKMKSYGTGGTVKTLDVDAAGLEGSFEAEWCEPVSKKPCEVGVAESPGTGVGGCGQGPFGGYVAFDGGDPEFTRLEILELELELPG